MNIKILLLLLLANTLCFAQHPGQIDTTFTTIDDGTYGYGSTTFIFDRLAAMQPDGKILLYSSINSYNDYPVGKLIRVDADGALDTTFAPSLDYTYDAKTLSVQPDGKILLSGYLGDYNNPSAPLTRLVRINNDGSLDNSFTVGAGDIAILTHAIQPDGKILVYGIFNSYNGFPATNIVRLNSDGSVDTTFTATNQVTIVDGVSSIMKLQQDGKIIIAGRMMLDNGTVTDRVIRLNSDGSLDTTFNCDITSVYFTSLLLQADGKIILGGAFLTHPNSQINGICRVNSDGSVDGTFILAPYPIFDARAIAITPEGNIIHGGDGSVNLFQVFNPDGSINSNYPSVETDELVSDVLIQPDGSLILAGLFGHVNGLARFGLAKLTPDYEHDTSFSPGSGADSDVNHVKVLPDGKILVAGNFTAFNNSIKKYIVKLNIDGTIDESFNIDNTVPITDIQAMHVYNDGKILVGGLGIARLNADGTTDDTFANNLTHINVRHIVVQFDGKILISGDFEFINGTTQFDLARLNADGTIDTSFTSIFRYLASIYSIQLQSDGKIIVAGSSLVPNSDQNIFRLNPDGSNDGTYGTFERAVFDAKILPDNKLIVALAPAPAGSNESRILRLNTDGSTDTSFNYSSSEDLSTFHIYLQPNGKILTVLDINDRKKLVRLNSDGSLDATFGSGEAMEWIFSSSYSREFNFDFQTDGNLIMGGYFSSYDGHRKRRLVRINSTDRMLSLPNVLPSDICAGSDLDVSYITYGTVAPNTVFTAQLSDAQGSFNEAINIGSLTGNTAGTISAVIPADTPQGTAYRIRVVNNTGIVPGVSVNDITIYNTPPPQGQEYQVINSVSQVATVRAIRATGENIEWFITDTDALNGEPSLSLDTPLNDNATYYAVQTMNGCRSNTLLAVLVHLVLDIVDVTKTYFTYYPNPVTDKLSISSSLEPITNVAIYNMLGQLVVQQDSDAAVQQINIAYLKTGSYIVKVTAGTVIKDIVILKN